VVANCNKIFSVENINSGKLINVFIMNEVHSLMA